MLPDGLSEPAPLGTSPLRGRIMVALSKLLTHKITKYKGCGFILLNFEVFCYAAIVNWNSHVWVCFLLTPISMAREGKTFALIITVFLVSGIYLTQG